jgi:hypothetical protein
MKLNVIPRMAGLSRHGFSTYLANPPSPVVMTRAMDDWSAMRTWTLDYFADRFGDFPIAAHAPQFEELANWGVRTNLRNYARYLRDPHGAEIEGRWLKGDAASFRESGETLYSGNFNPAHPKYGQPDEIFRAVPETPDFIDSWLRLLRPSFVAECRRIQPHYFVYLSAKGAYTPLHMDFWDTHAFLAQISGLKRATLFHPDDAELLLSDATRDVRTMLGDPRYTAVVGWTADLGPGDLLVVPSRWLHFVETLEFSITYSMDWAGATNWRAYVRNGKAALKVRGISR